MARSTDQFMFEKLTAAIRLVAPENIDEHHQVFYQVINDDEIEYPIIAFLKSEEDRVEALGGHQRYAQSYIVTAYTEDLPDDEASLQEEVNAIERVNQIDCEIENVLSREQRVVEINTAVIQTIDDRAEDNIYSITRTIRVMNQDKPSAFGFIDSDETTNFDIDVSGPDSADFTDPANPVLNAEITIAKGNEDTPAPDRFEYRYRSRLIKGTGTDEDNYDTRDYSIWESVGDLSSDATREVTIYSNPDPNPDPDTLVDGPRYYYVQVRGANSVGPGPGTHEYEVVLSNRNPDGTITLSLDNDVLTWNDLDDPSIIRWEYRFKAGTASYGAWTILSDTAVDDRSFALSSLTLNSGTEYTFMIRAVNNHGATESNEETRSAT